MQVKVSKPLGTDIGLGGPGSGNWGHAGRAGQRGGSQTRSSAVSLRTGKTAKVRQAIAKNPDRELAVTQTGTGGRVNIVTPYDAGFVDALKTQIPYRDRSWNRTRSRWEVSADYAERAKKVVGKYFRHIDGEEFSPKEIKQIKKARNVRLISNAQKKLRALEATMREEEARLDNLVNRVSRRRQGDVIRRRNLLSYTLRDMYANPGKMESIQKKGLLAALRYMEEL